ncbi:Receptor tyrosine-protein kinase erbB-2, partial [Cichlidogyrus casuarinus]
KPLTNVEYEKLIPQQLLHLHWRDIKFDRRSYLGEGSTSLVYRAKWRVPKKLYDTRTLTPMVDFPVVVKVLRLHPQREGVDHPKKLLARLQRQNSLYEKDSTSDSGEEAFSFTHFGALFAESKDLAVVKHPNCLPLIGVLASSSYPCLIYAHLPLGTLKDFLPANRANITSLHMITWAQQIASAMTYLEGMGLVHGNLAARNVLLQNEYCTQLTDFGERGLVHKLVMASRLSSTSIEYCRPAAPDSEELLVRWMA